MSSSKRTSGKSAASKSARSPQPPKAPVASPELRARLARAIPEPRCELEFENPWQLLVATILSAQSTDARVNQVTPALFRRFPTPAALGQASQEEVEVLVKSTGFFRNKARAIREASQGIAERFGGELPRTLEELTTLRGVARKTANLVLGTALGVPSGIIVDTHAARVAGRLGLTREDDPEKIERDLVAAFPRAEWIATGHRLVLHGRYVCLARKPDCAGCPLNELCPGREAGPVGTLAAREAGEAERMPAR